VVLLECKQIKTNFRKVANRMLSETKQQEFKDMVTIKDKWYHKIPYIGRKIRSKQAYKKYSRNKSEIFKMITEEVNKELAKNDYINDYVNQFFEADKTMFYDSERITARNANLDKYKQFRKVMK
jgi:FMN-dependent NADH-azoreductase